MILARTANASNVNVQLDRTSRDQQSTKCKKYIVNEKSKHFLTRSTTKLKPMALYGDMRSASVPTLSEVLMGQGTHERSYQVSAAARIEIMTPHPLEEPTETMEDDRTLLVRSGRPNTRLRHLSASRYDP